MVYGPWHYYGPLSYQDGFHLTNPPYDPNNLNAYNVYDRYRFAGVPSPGPSYPGGGTAQWVLYQSFESYQLGRFPQDYDSARDCCLWHARNAERGVQFNWDPGVCENLRNDHSANSASGGGGPQNVDLATGAQYFGFEVGSSSSWSPSPLPFIAASYGVNVALSGFTYYRKTPAEMGLDDDDLAHRAIPVQILLQMPEFLERVGPTIQNFSQTDFPAFWAASPLTEVLRVDGQFQAVVRDAQTAQDEAFSVRLHSADGATGVQSYNELGPVIDSMSSTQGSAMGVHTFPDVQYGDSHQYALSSGRVDSALDPGPANNYLCDGAITYDSTWWVRVRYPGKRPPLRWRQRDDGLGLSGVKRQRGGTSIQASNRKVSAYR